MHMDIFSFYSDLSTALINHVRVIIQRTLWNKGLRTVAAKDNCMGVFVFKNRSQNYEKYYYKKTCCRS